MKFCGRHRARHQRDDKAGDEDNELDSASGWQR